MVDKGSILSSLSKVERTMLTMIHYTLWGKELSDQILAALGKHTEQKRSSFREGVLYLDENKLDVFFVTLNKSEKDYSPSTMYQDYSINVLTISWIVGKIMGGW